MDRLPYVDLKGSRVTVMGLGRSGDGIGAVRFLTARGARVTVTDLLGPDDLAGPLAQIADCPVEACHLGGHVESDFVDAELVVVNSAVGPDNPFLERAREAGVLLTSEIGLFWQFHRGRTIGVTGSNGKSTTAAMLHGMLQAAGFACRLGSNVGASLLPDVDQIAPHEWSVLELSSFQLDSLGRLPASPNLAVVTNFASNHLDWHGSLSSYRRAKQCIVRWQSPRDVAVLNGDDPDVANWTTYGRTLWFGSRDLGRDGIYDVGTCQLLRFDGRSERFPLRDWVALPGRHNHQNAMAAACAAVAAGADLDAVRRGLQSYKPLPHRLEPLGEIAGRVFYNDSLARSPESAIVALEALSPRPIVLLTGGDDNQLDLESLGDAICRRAKAVSLMGQTGEMLGGLLDSHPDGDRLAFRECGSFEEAFRFAVENSRPGDAVLLSPGCASHDWFENFAERGRRFADLVEEWRREMENGA